MPKVMVSSASAARNSKSPGSGGRPRFLDYTLANSSRKKPRRYVHPFKSIDYLFDFRFVLVGNRDGGFANDLCRWPLVLRCMSSQVLRQSLSLWLKGVDTFGEKWKILEYISLGTAPETCFNSRESSCLHC